MLAERCGGRLLLPDVGALFAARTDGRVRGPVRQPADREVRLDPAVRGGWQKGVRHEDRSCLPLTPAVLAAHLKGEAHIGLYPLLDGDRCWWVAADFDGPEAMFDALMYVKAGRGLQVPVALEVSRPGVGAHAWVFFTAPVPAELARRLGTGLLREAMALRGRMTLASYDRLFPSQDLLPAGGIGNLIAAPLFKPAWDNGATVFLDLETPGTARGPVGLPVPSRPDDPGRTQARCRPCREGRGRRRGHPAELGVLD